MDKKRILVVEDDEDIRKLVSALLKKKSYEVVCACDGEHAMQEIHKAPDLVILDLQLPDISGEEICKFMRESDDEKMQNIPIIMLTGKVKISDRIVGRVIGANIYITKPFNIPELIQGIEKTLGIAA